MAKMKFYYWILGLVVMIFLIENGIILLKIRSKGKDHETFAPQLQELAEYRGKNEFNIQTLLCYLDIDGQHVPDMDVRCVRPEEEKKKCDTISRPLSTLLGREKIIFRFFRFSCTSCVTEQLARLEEFAGKVGRENILLLTDGLHEQIDKFMRQEQIELSVYQLKDSETTLLPYDKELTPYLLYVDSQRNVKTSVILSIDTQKYSKYFYYAVGRRMEKLQAAKNKE